MGKNKLYKFAQMETFHNVFQCSMNELHQHLSSVPEMRGNWHSRYFHNDHPICLELGCGHGEYTVGLARMYPQRNFIGIDIKGARMWRGAKEAELTGMSNVAFLRTNIEMLPYFFGPDEVSELWITFPDPQMKKATKRLTSTFFMERYLQFLRPESLIHLKTDSPFLYTYTREMISLNSLPLLADTDDLYATDASLYTEARALQTHYEHQWLERGLTIKYLCWRPEPRSPYQEPDIDIEKDTYRSYGRNYQTQS